MSSTILVADNVSVRYKGARAPAVVGVSLAVAPAQTVGLVGESGSGKTTLGRALVGLVRPTTGSVRVHGRLWSEVRWRDAMRRRVQMIFQDPYGALNPRLTAQDAVAEAVRVSQTVSKRVAHARAAELLRDVGLDVADQSRRPARLSGGQCQRVGIARALACDPEVLVADEPTSALDVSVQARILDTLEDLCTSRRMALVLISHDLAVVAQLTERVLVMHDGHVVEDTATRVALQNPRDAYTQELIESLPERWSSLPRTP